MEFAEIMKRRLLSFDYLLFGMVLGLSIFGVIIVGSATHITQSGFSEEYNGQKIWVITGICLLLLASFIDYNFICRFYWLAYIVNIILLIAVPLIGTKMTTADVTRRIEIGSFSIQPSEFAKVFMLVFLAQLIEQLDEKLNNFFVLLLISLSIALPVYLIIRQPSLSAAMVVMSVSVVILFIGGVSYKYVIPAIAVTIPAVYFFVQDVFREDHLFVHNIFQPYQLNERIIPFFRPEMAEHSVRYQTEQSILAIGSGQLSGKGLYEGTLNSLYYLPASHNDFIFAVIGEELGYVGCVAVLSVLFIIILKCIYIAYRANNLTGKLIAAGAAFMLAFQTFINVGVSMGILPNTGMVLPFISYGGSSMWVNMVAIGLVINVGMAKPVKDGFTLFEE